VQAFVASIAVDIVFRHIMGLILFPNFVPCYLFSNWKEWNVIRPCTAKSTLQFASLFSKIAYFICISNICWVCDDNRLVVLGMATHAQKKWIVPLAVKPLGNVLLLLLVLHRVNGNHQKQNMVPFESVPSYILFCLFTICHRVIYFLGISSAKYVVCINWLRGLWRPSDILFCKHKSQIEEKKG